MKKISLDALLKGSGAESYQEQYQYVRGLIEEQQIKAVKASPLNGKKPALHLSYWLMEDTADNTRQIEELQFEMAPVIRTDYYLNHLDVYRSEEKWVKLLNRYFLRLGEREPEPVSLNERSFQIWGREKFLQREQGKKVLAHCGIAGEQLCVYGTTEPLAYYSGSRMVPQTVLILENKDTFYSMRRHLMNGAGRILGEEIGTVVYGAGKGILRSFEDFRFCVEAHVNDSRNRILYFGDLDYEGIGIYERLAALFGCADKECAGEKISGTGLCGKARVHEIRPFVQAYEKMIQKAREYGMDFMPETSEHQNRNLSGRFFQYFTEEIREMMQEILKAGKYIPQEIVNISDFGEDGCSTNF